MAQQNLMKPDLPEFVVHWLPGCVLLRQVSLLSAGVGTQVPGRWGGAESPRR